MPVSSFEASAFCPPPGLDVANYCSLAHFDVVALIALPIGAVEFSAPPETRK